MISIVIADDHQMFIDAMKSILHSFENIEVVGEANNGDDVLALLKNTPADILILDINMPGKDGIETAKEVIRKFPDVKVLMVTMYKQKEFIAQLVTAGVSGYILKNTGAQELYDAIRVVYDGAEFFGEDVTKEILQSMRHRLTEAEPAHFSSREREILKLLVNELNSQEIADKLLISHYTVESHRSHMLAKAGVKNTAGLIKYAINSGLV